MKARNAIHSYLGTTQEAMPIMIAATHTHAGFNFTNTSATIMVGGEEKSLYEAYYLPALKEAVDGALSDLSPATMYMGETAAVTEAGKPLTAVRRYLVQKSDGGTGYGNENQGTIIGKLYEEFDRLQVLRFVRPAAPDILMTSLGVHATMTGSTEQYYASADYPGAVRYYVETNDRAALGKDCWYVPFISGAGDQTGESKLADLSHGMNYVQYGEAVSQVILNYLANEQLRPLANGDIKSAKTNESYASSRLVIDFGKSPEANEAITALIKKYIAVDTTDSFVSIKERFNDPNYSFSQKDEYAITMGSRLALEIRIRYGVSLPEELQFQGYYHANGILTRLNKTSDTEALGLNAIRIGDLALTFHSYELYGTSAQWLLTGTSNATDPTTGRLTGETRTASPFGANTFVVSHANGANGYVPHEEAYVYNCYESYVSNVASSAEAALHDHMILILNALKQQY